MLPRCMNSFRWSCKLILLSLILIFGISERALAQYFPIHATVQWPSPQSPYLADYSTAGRDRLIVTLLNRDQQQPLLLAKLRLQLKSGGFTAKNREEVVYPMLELNTGVPIRLTSIDLAPYLQPQNLQTTGNLRNGQLPTGYAELSVQVVDYYTARPLSDWHTARTYLDVKKPPILNLPEQDAQVALRDPLFIRFQWTPRHQGLSGTEYEFVLKELPDNGVAPQSAFAYGQEIYRTHTRSTSLSYTHLDPLLLPNRRYAWQVRALSREGVAEFGMFEHGGYSEISWFTLNNQCDAPRGLKAQPRFAKVDLSWSKVLGTTGYIVECRPKTKLNVYEWSQTEVAGDQLTLSQLKPGWTYEWRVGTRCTGNRPVFSEVREFTLSKYNETLLADCGKEPVRPDLAQDPHLGIRAGDIVTIGGDYPMSITEVSPLGDGWYAGKGKTRLKSIIDAPIALHFDRLRINVDKYQIDGTVEASYDETKAKIVNLDYIDDGGKDIKPATIRMREHKMNFTLPDIPQLIYNPKIGELETTDAEGNPQTIKIDVPENASYESIFPMLVTDNKGNTYQISPSERNSEGTGNDVENKNKGEKIELNCERVDRVGDFNTESLSSKYGYIHFKRGDGKYAFDEGQENWYKKSVKVDRFYKPFSKGYIAPWKLVPVGENDIVMAKYDGLKNIDLKKVRFVSEPNSTALPARLNETEQTWTITLRSVSAGASYDIFAVYEGVVIGKLCVVSYSKQKHKLTLVPINDAKLDKTYIERELNAVYAPIGIHFNVEVDERMRGNYSWEVLGEQDKLLSLVGKSFWGYDKELKESTEMLNLQKTYQQAAGTLDGVYLFVLNGATGLEGQKGDLLGEMPRKSRFGYIFAGNSPNTEEIIHTIAHELGHGIFTLQHTFDAEYGKGTRGKTNNLLDYPSNPLDYKEKTELAAFQWNIMASPAIFTALDKKKEGKLGKQGRIWLTPDWKPFVCDVSDELVSIPQEIPNGTIGGIRYGGQVYTYRSAQKAYVNTTGASLPIQIPSSGDSIFLVNRAEGVCGTIYRGTWAYVIGHRNFNFADSTTLNYVCPVKCVSLSPDRAVPNGASVLYFVGKTSSYKDKILDQLYDELVKRGDINQFTQNKFTDQVCFAITQQGEDLEASESFAYLRRIYAQVVILQVKVSEDGTISLVNLAPSKPLKSGDAILDFNHIKGLIADEPWYMQAILLYELADLLDQGIEHLKIPESVWRCSGEPTVYKRIVSNLFSVLCPQVLITDDLLGRQLSEEAKFAFACGLWNGTVDIVQSVPQLVKLLTCVFHADCRESASSQWESFKNAVIEDESGHILCHQDEYFCKAKQMISIALSDLVADDCKVAHTVGSIVGPTAVMCIGDVAAGEALIAQFGKVGSGLKYAIKGLQLCDKITDITRPLAKGLKVSAVLVKKVGKLLPEIRIEGKTVLHYVGDKLHIRRFDAVTKQAVDEPIEESESVLIGKLEKQLRMAENSVDKPSDAVVKTARIADERIVSGESMTPSRSLSPELTALQKESVQRYQNLGLEQLVSFREHPAYQQLSDVDKTKFFKKLQGFEDDVLRELDADEQALKEFVNSLKSNAKSEQAWFKRIREGIAFNKERAEFYPFNEVYLEAPKKGTKVAGDSPAKHKYVRLDSYDPQIGEIVSRKKTQLYKVSDKTAIRYLKELKDKYAPGAIIADVPSNKTGSNKGIFKVNNGKVLKGQMILEVPVQEEKISPKVLEYANDYNIKIRDIKGKSYN